MKIGTDITVTVLKIDRHQVKLGVAAPKNIVVHREEIAQRIADGIPPPSK